VEFLLTLVFGVLLLVAGVGAPTDHRGTGTRFAERVARRHGSVETHRTLIGWGYLVAGGVISIVSLAGVE
jgi:uncharacterized membrane protein HdeD (DUF308 family)